MKTKLSIVLFLLYSITTFSNVNWYHSLEDAQKIARATNKLILVDFWADWCGPCKKMDSDVWSKDEIKELSDNFIPVKIDFDTQKQLVARYGVKAIPMILILDAYGEVIYSSIGYKDKDHMKKILEEFSVNMVTIYPALDIYTKSQDNFNSNLRVAQKYQDVAYYLKEEGKRSFLKQSSTYLNNAYKINKKGDTSEELSEKVGLLKILNSAYNERYKFVLKKLDKDFKNVSDSNKSLYLFLRWYNNFQLENVKELEEHFTDLQSLPANDKYVKLANQILKNNNS